MKKMLIVEDDKRLAHLIGAFFSRSGFDVSLIEKGLDAIQYCQKETPDIIILDLMLPDSHGITICSKLRHFYKGKILILTASSNDLDQIDGFETGADDFVIKPVEPRVLLARVNSLLKRGDINTSALPIKILTFGKLVIDNTSKIVSLDNHTIKLTSQEFDLLLLLAQNAGEILSRDAIYESIRGIEYDGVDRAIDIKISRLRKKLNDIASEPQKIKTIWGKGYLFVGSAWET